jgi:thiopurine S-methyltransferase
VRPIRASRAAPRVFDVDRAFWLERWRLDQIRFHQADYNARLQRYWPGLGVPAAGQVFVPLCGKSRDMLWLAERGHSVVGVELAAIAVEAFFEAADLAYTQRRHGALTLYQAERVRIFCGDVFDLTAADLSGTVGVFDRGGLVALPPPLRSRYVEHLLDTLQLGAVTLLLTVEYGQARVTGPPFAVLPDEVDAHYGARCSIERLDASVATAVPLRFAQAGVESALESTYRIVKER